MIDSTKPRSTNMTPSSTKQWILASKPSGAPTWSGPDATFKLQTAELPALKEGQVLAQVRYFSNDTGLRHCKIHVYSSCLPGVSLTTRP